MRFLLLTLFLLGCRGSDKAETGTPPASEPPAKPADAAVATPAPGDAAPDLPVYLRGDVADSYDRRADVARCGPASFGPELPDTTPRCDFEGELPDQVVIGQRDGAVRIAHERYGIRAALWVRASDLAERPGAPTPLAASATSDEPTGVELLGGAPVAVTGRKGDRLAVELSEAGVTVRGFIPAAAMATVYQRPPEVGETAARIERAVDIRKPGTKRVIAKVEADDAFHRSVRIVGDEAAGRRAIELSTPHLRIRGQVDAGAVEAAEILGRGGKLGTGFSGGWGGLKIVWLELPAGTPLAAEPGGEPVAAVIRDGIRVALGHQRRDGWLRVEFRTSWGGTSAWVECAAVERPGPKAPLRCTTADDPDRIEPLPTR